MRFGRGTLVSWLVARFARLRFPVLFAITGSLFVADLLVPDVIPLADEILLGLGTALLGSLRSRGGRGAEPVSGGGGRA
jgi:hypothetical protein